VITINEVETLIKTKTRAKARIQRLEQRVGDSVAFLSYSIDDKNQMTIWHTEIPRSLQHIGIGRRLVEEAVQLASRDSSRLRIVCVCAGTPSASSRAHRGGRSQDFDRSVSVR
jgi:uncharacterized protein